MPHLNFALRHNESDCGVFTCMVNLLQQNWKFVLLEMLFFYLQYVRYKVFGEEFDVEQVVDVLCEMLKLYL